MRTLFIGICIIFSFTCLAQNKCASAEYVERLKKLDPSFPLKLNALENFISHRSTSVAQSAQKEDAGAVIHIPVVVHVIYNSASQNISDEQIKSQIDALNRDYRRQNADSVNTPARFKAVAADIHIDFALATADPLGRATTGIVRKHTGVSVWESDDKIKSSAQGGDDPWDSRYYLNIWVGYMVNLLGYSSVPGGPSDKDGVVINSSAFGTINVSGPYNMGRTAVHEIGHWLGLKHIWGDANCGDDLVEDTPKQGTYTTGCPGGAFRSSCDNGALGDMYMNYMDFTDDACLNLFTEGQKQRMLALFNSGGPRETILSSKGLDKPWTEGTTSSAIGNNDNAKGLALTVQVYPNPAAGDVTVSLNDNAWIGKSIAIINMNGSIVATTQLSSLSQKINVSNLPSGVYFIHAVNNNQKLNQRFVKL